MFRLLIHRLRRTELFLFSGLPFLHQAVENRAAGCAMGNVDAEVLGNIGVAVGKPHIVNRTVGGIRTEIVVQPAAVGGGVAALGAYGLKRLKAVANRANK